jgi:antitoxin (DNA-binding transcriptional repressor) of toxin-antitoxin stability system
MQVNILEAKTRLSQLIKAALGGEEVVIANRDRPVAIDSPDGRERLSRERASARGDRLAAWMAASPLLDCARRGASEIDAALWTHDDRLARSAPGFAVNLFWPAGA